MTVHVSVARYFHHFCVFFLCICTLFAHAKVVLLSCLAKKMRSNFHFFADFLPIIPKKSLPLHSVLWLPPQDQTYWVNQEAFIDALFFGYQELRKFLYQVKNKVTIDAYEVCKHHPHAASGRQGVALHIGVGSIVARSTWQGIRRPLVAGRAQYGSSLLFLFIAAHDGAWSGIAMLGSPDKRWGQIVVESRKIPIFAAWKRKYMNN